MDFSGVKKADTVFDRRVIDVLQGRRYGNMFPSVMQVCLSIAVLAEGTTKQVVSVHRIKHRDM